jgi:DNA-binding response OmpR family regulator
VTGLFSLRELTARVRAVLRRSSVKDDQPLLNYRGTHSWPTSKPSPSRSIAKPFA